jgi:transcriptional regulator with XRE-family HTH domain
METIVGKNIKLFRDKLGLTQEMLAEYLGVSRAQVNRYENGSIVPTDKLTKLAELFSIDEYDFYEENDAIMTTNVAFAFRADELSKDDLISIASFKKLAMNYLKMQQALNNE